MNVLNRRSTRPLVLAVLAAICVVPVAFAQTASSAPSATMPAPAMTPAEFYGLWAIAPALVAIILAIATRQVIVALALGVFTAAGMLCVLHGVYNPIRFVIYAMDHFVLGVLAPVKDAGGVDLEHLIILIYTLFIGAMIGVLSASGGTRAVVARVTRRVHSRRSGQVSAWFAGLAVFFDDYASAMIVGPGLRPIFDRLKLSREKLAYIVNWTAAPDASLFLSTWLAVQISYIGEGFKMLGDQPPSFLAGTTAATTFWATIPYRVYPLLALVMVFLIAMTGRDFGPMRRAERAASDKADPPAPQDVTQPRDSMHWMLGALPAVVLVLMTLGLMAGTGWSNAHGKGMTMSFYPFAAARDAVMTILGQADSNFALLYASFTAAVLAIVLAVASRSLTLSKTMEGAVAGMTHMFAACIILVLAWGLARASKDLELGRVAKAFLQSHVDRGTFSVTYLPLVVFLIAAFVSFSTGTSWGTMAILCPPVVAIAAGLVAPMPADQALPLFYASVGAAMAGAVFGNTCSPLADVTVLSSIFSECELAAHVRTTLPYAIIVAAVSLICTDGLAALLRRFAPEVFARYWNIYFALAAGAVLLFLILLMVGRRPPQPVRSQPEASAPGTNQ